MLVPAPGLFSIATCWPQIRDSRSAVMRATVSVGPPGAYGTTIGTGWVGQSCASAERLIAGASACAASGHAAAELASSVIHFIDLPGRFAQSGRVSESLEGEFSSI